MYLSQSAYLTNTIVIISSIPHHKKAPPTSTKEIAGAPLQLHLQLRLNKHINYTNKHYAIHAT